MVVRCTPTASAISATVCCLFPSGPVAAYMRRTVAACRAFSLGLRPPVRPRARARGQALPGSLDDQLALELIDRAEEMKHQPPGRRGRVDLLLQHDQAHAALAQLIGQCQQVLQRPHRAGQPGDHEDVARAQVSQGPVELGAGGFLADAVSVKIFSHP
jgi:hypothetical protein